MCVKFIPGIVFLLLACASGIAGAQGVKADTAFVQQAGAEAIAVYQQALGKQLHLFNGPEYVEHRKPQLSGHPFFETDKLTDGDVYYDGAWFRQVPVRYDVVTEEVMTSNAGAMQKLLPDKLASFILNGHTFVRYDKDSLSGGSMQSGYYDLLYNEAITVVAKRAKSVQERVARGKVEGEYEAADKYYIWKEGTYYPVNSNSALLHVFEDKKKQLRRHLQSRKLKFNRQKEETILEAARFYASSS